MDYTELFEIAKNCCKFETENTAKILNQGFKVFHGVEDPEGVAITLTLEKKERED